MMMMLMMGGPAVKGETIDACPGCLLFSPLLLYIQYKSTYFRTTLSALDYLLNGGLRLHPILLHFVGFDRWDGMGRE